MDRQPKIVFLTGETENYNRDTILVETLTRYMPSNPEDAVNLLMNAKIKELLGSLNYTFMCMGHRYAVEMPNQKDAWIELLRAYFPTSENVLDARKSDEDQSGLKALNHTLSGVVQGCHITAEPFLPYCGGEENGEILRRVFKTIHSIDQVRETALGTLLASGKKPVRGMKTVFEAMRYKESGDVLSSLVAEIRGDKEGIFFFDEEDEKEEKGSKSGPRIPVVSTSKDATSMEEVFSTILVDGRLICQVKDTDRKIKGMGDLRGFGLRIDCSWMDFHCQWTVDVPLPKILKTFDTGHMVVQLTGKHKLFRPFFRYHKELKVEEISFFRFLQDQVVLAFREIVEKRSYQSIHAKSRVESTLTKAIRGKVAMFESWTPQSALVRLLQWDVVSPPVKDNLKRWELEQEMFTELVIRGFNINCTSKGKPGTSVSRPGKHGFPNFIQILSPFCFFMDNKRQPEMRELCQALVLARPTEMRVQSKGYKVPKALASCIRELRVVIADSNHSFFIVDRNGEKKEVCHDTYVSCPSFLTKTQLRYKKEKFETLEEVETFKSGLVESGFCSEEMLDDRVEVNEVSLDLGDGLYSIRYEVVVDYGCYTDLGKIKGIGALKGVPTPLDEQLYAVEPDGSKVEVDLIIPAYSFWKKKEVPAYLRGLAEKAGLHEIDPDWFVGEDPTASLLGILEQIQVMLEEKGYDVEGRQRVVGDDGREIGFVPVLMLPFYRPSQTGESTSKARDEEEGFSVHVQMMHIVEEFPEVGETDALRFAQIVEAWREVAGDSHSDTTEWTWGNVDRKRILEDNRRLMASDDARVETLEERWEKATVRSSKGGVHKSYVEAVVDRK